MIRVGKTETQPRTPRSGVVRLLEPAAAQRVPVREPQQANPHSGLQLQQATHREELPVRRGEPPEQEVVQLFPACLASYGPIPRQVAERAQEGAL